MVLGVWAAACGAPIEEDSRQSPDSEDVGAFASQLSSHGSVTSAFPSVVHISTYCTATKIDSGKFLTAPACSDRLTAGSWLRYTNHPRGLDGAPESAVRSARVKSVELLTARDVFFRPSDSAILAIIMLQDLHSDDYPSMPLERSLERSGQAWVDGGSLTLVGYGADALDPGERGKQTAQFKAMTFAAWDAIAEDELEDLPGPTSDKSFWYWRGLMPFQSNDAEGPGLDADIGGPLLIESGGVWRMTALYDAPARSVPKLPRVYYSQFLYPTTTWFQYAGYGSGPSDLPVPSTPTFTRSLIGCLLGIRGHGVNVAADRGFRFQSELKEGDAPFEPIRNDDARSFAFSVSGLGGPVTFRVRACNVSGCGGWASSTFISPPCQR